MKKSVIWPLLATGLLLVPSMSCSDLRLKPDLMIASVELEPNDLIVLEGEEVELTPRVIDSRGDEVELPTWYKPIWTTTDAKAVSVQAGVITGKSGTATISVQIVNRKASAKVRVNPILEDMKPYAAYVIQSIQGHPDPTVRIIEDRAGLLRVFAVVEEDHYYEVPELGVRVESNGMTLDTVLKQEHGEIHAKDPGAGDFDFSYDLELSADMIQSGMTIGLTFDPADQIRGIGGSQVIEPDMTRVRTQRQIIVPTISSSSPPEVVDWAAGLHEEHEDMWWAKTLLPISDRELVVHETFHTTRNLRRRNGWVNWLSDILAIYQLEGSQRGSYYYGAILPFNGAFAAGLGFVGRPVAVGFTDGDVFAHELGHNMSLYHAPCGGPGSVDRNFPNPDGSIGDWGYNPLARRLIRPTSPDIMGYCDRSWISNYHFEKALSFRKNSATQGVQGEGLMIWGVEWNGALELNPIFAVKTRLSVPDLAGLYEAVGYDARGEVLFSFRFNSLELDHDNTRLFNIVIPRGDWTLSSVMVNGPGVMATIAHGADPMAIVWSESGQVRAILSDVGTIPAMFREDRVIISDGIPGERR